MLSKGGAPGSMKDTLLASARHAQEKNRICPGFATGLGDPGAQPPP